MIDDKIFISIAVIKAKSGKTEQVKKLLLGMIAPTRKEAGCIEYILFCDKEDPNIFYMREAFRDQAAFDFHIATDYFQKLEAEIKDIVSEPIKLIKLNRLVE